MWRNDAATRVGLRGGFQAFPDLAAHPPQRLARALRAGGGGRGRRRRVVADVRAPAQLLHPGFDALAQVVLGQPLPRLGVGGRVLHPDLRPEPELDVFEDGRLAARELAQVALGQAGRRRARTVDQAAEGAASASASVTAAWDTRAASRNISRSSIRASRAGPRACPVTCSTTRTSESSTGAPVHHGQDALDQRRLRRGGCRQHEPQAASGERPLHRRASDVAGR